MKKRNRVLNGLGRRPVTAILTSLVGGTGIWIGLILSLYRYPTGRLASFQGPLSFWGLPTWGHLFVAFGVLQLARLLFLWHRAVDTGLHILSMIVVVMWTVSMFFGPISTAQPAYTFMTVVCLGSLYITDIINYGSNRIAHWDAGDLASRNGGPPAVVWNSTNNYSPTYTAGATAAQVTVQTQPPL